MTDRLSDRTRAAREEFERFDTVLERALGRVEAIEGLEFSAAPTAFRAPRGPGAPGGSVVLGPDGQPAGGGAGRPIGAGPGGRITTSSPGSFGTVTTNNPPDQEDRLIAPEYCLTASGDRVGGPALPSTTILSQGAAIKLPNGGILGYRVGACFYRADAINEPGRVSRSGSGATRGMQGGGGGGGGPRVTFGGPSGTGHRVYTAGNKPRQNAPNGQGSASAAASAAFNFPTESLERGLGEVASQVKGLRQDLAAGDGGASLAFKGLR